MKRFVLAVLLVLVALTSGGGVFRRVAMYPTALFTRTDGFQTNAGEVARFTGLSGSGTYATDRASLSSHATTALNSWPYTITAGAWESDAGVCEPVGATQTGSEYEISFAATDIFAMALSGEIENSNTLRAAVRTRLLELTGITDFEATDISGGNQCILDLGSAAPHIVEAAMLLEDGGYSGWTYNDRVTLATWLTTEVFPLVSWGIDARKNNWGIVTFAGALTIAGYAEGGLPYITKYNGTNVAPATYLSTAGTPLAKWLSTANGDELDSDCQDAGQIFGLQSYGGFPDELRRSVGTADCPETSLAFDSPRGDSTFYQQKTTNGLAHVCEILRRHTGSGATCFDITSHGGDDEAVYDAAQFSTGATFQSYYLDDTAQGFRYVAGEYYADDALKAALDDGSVSVRGGRDYAYTKITHAVGVAYISQNWTATFGPCTSGVDCFCDRVRGNGPLGVGDPIYNTNVFFCEDWDHDAFYATTPTDVNDTYGRGNWVSTSGAIFGSGDRGGGSRYSRKYLDTSPGTTWRDGQPTTTCGSVITAVGGSGIGSGTTEYDATDRWCSNSYSPHVDIIHSATDYTAENSTSSVPTIPGSGGAVVLGDNLMAHRNRAGGIGSYHGTVSRSLFGGTRSQLGITSAIGYESNVIASNILTSAWKHNEFSAVRDGSNNDGLFGFRQTNSPANTFPIQGFIFGSGFSCATAIAGITETAGNVGCAGTNLIYHALSGTGPGFYTWPTDFNLNELHCMQAWWDFRTISSVNLKMAIDGDIVIDASGINLTGSLYDATSGTDGVDQFAFNNYSNYADQVTPLTVSTRRFEDNLVMRDGKPVDCSDIGFPTSYDVTF